MVTAIRFGLILGALLSFSSATWSQADGPSLNPITMGLILPLSGEHAQSGVQMKNAALLAFAQLPAAVKRRLKLVFEDDALNGAKAVSAFNKLVVYHQAAAILAFGGQSVAALAPLAEKRGVLLFGLTADAGLVRDRRLAFQHWLSSAEQARVLIKQFDRLKPQRIALAATTHNAALDILAHFEQEAVSRGYQIAFKQDFQLAETDFRSALLRLKAAAPQAIMVVLVAPQMQLFMRQLRQAGVSAPVFSSANAEIVSEVSGAQGAMEGVIYAGPALTLPFIEAFEARYTSYPEFAVPHVYDAVTLVGEAAASGAADAAAINTWLIKQGKFRGSLGAYELAEGFRFAVQAVPKQILNGKFVRLEEN